MCERIKSGLSVTKYFAVKDALDLFPKSSNWVEE